MSFERFVRAKCVEMVAKQPEASIRANGKIGFNRKASEEYNLYDFDYVVLFFDRVTRIVGMRFINDCEEEGACKLSRGNGGKELYISAKVFMKRYGLLRTKSYSFAMERILPGLNGNPFDDLLVFKAVRQQGRPRI